MLETSPLGPSREEGARRLGDAWRDWDAARGRDESDIRVGPALYLAVLAALAAVAGLLWALLVWVAQPRLGALGLGAPLVGVLRGAGVAAAVLPWALLAICGAGAPAPRPAARLLRRAALSSWPWVCAAGRLLGLSRDRLGHSFLRVTNRLAIAAGAAARGHDLLLLAPRCLRRDQREALQVIAAEAGASFAIAGGGEQARETIRRAGPAGVLAVACERDLVEGVRGVAPGLAVLSLPNRRPDGPCRNSEIDLAEARRLLGLLRGVVGREP